MSALLHGEPVNRRGALRIALRAGAATALGAGLPSVLGGCTSGTVVKVAPNVDYYVVFGGGQLMPPGGQPLGELVSLMTPRAVARGVVPVLDARTDDATQLAQLPRALAPTNAIDPATGENKLRAAAVVIGRADPEALAPIARDAIAAGLKVVSYLVPFEPRTAAITVDPARLGTLLATHAAAWARRRLGGRGAVLLVMPADDLRTTGPYAVTAGDSERAIRSTLARLAPGLDVVEPVLVSDYPVGDVPPELTRALRSHRDVRIVLSWNDVGAVAGALALRASRATPPEDLYAGGLGSPAMTSRATIDALRRDDVLRAIVAVRPRDLADALVELPRALMLGQPARDVTIAPATLTRGSAALAAFARDYGDGAQAALDALPMNSATSLNPDLARSGATGK